MFNYCLFITDPWQRTLVLVNLLQVTADIMGA
jgi:hypothetical protein